MSGTDVPGTEVVTGSGERPSIVKAIAIKTSTMTAKPPATIGRVSRVINGRRAMTGRATGTASRRDDRGAGSGGRLGGRASCRGA